VKIGINIISLFPWCFFPRIAGRILAGLKDEVKFLQLLPLRGYSGLTVALFKTPFIYVEGPWNGGSFLGVFQRLFTKDEDYPTFWDFLFFGNRNRAWGRFRKLHALRGAIAVEHQSSFLKERGASTRLIELNPEEARPEDTPREASLVFDLEHMFRKGRHGEPPILKSLPEFAEFLRERASQIRVIHYKPDFDERARMSLLCVWLKAEAKYPVHLVLEYTPSLKSVLFPRRYIKEMVKDLQRYTAS
jgi:hypothetical protein